MAKEAVFEYVKDGFPEDLVRFKGAVLRGDPRVYAADIAGFAVRGDDVWLGGFMRSGTHWASEMVWRVASDAGLRSTETQRARFPWFDALVEPNYRIDAKITYEDVLSHLQSLPSPRFLRTHLPFHLLPRQLRSGERTPKMVYIARNPKDVCVSEYYFFKHFYNFKGSLEELCDLFVSDKVSYAPYWDNVLSFWQKRKDFNILFLKYEDMKNDTPSVIRKTAEFFGKNLTDEQVSALSTHLSFESYSKDPALTYQNLDEMYNKRFGHQDGKGFVRKGTTQQWRLEMPARAARRMDQWSDRHLRDTDYEI